jgi:hypothetical protein
MDMLGYGLRKARVCALQQATDGMVWVDGWTRGMGGLLVIIHDSIHG